MAARLPPRRRRHAGARTHLERAAHLLEHADAGQPRAMDVQRLLAELNGGS